MRTKPIKSLPKDVFSSIDNQKQPSTPTGTTTFKTIQSDNKHIPIAAVVNNKENRNSHAFITSSYDCNTIPLKQQQQQQQPRPFYKHIAQTFTTDIDHDRVLPTTQRPTMGGKTISSIHRSTPSSTLVTTRMSSEELKLLSRRIDPHEPLSSPHASPTKPPLPVLSKKRRRSITTTTTTSTTTNNNNNSNSPPAKSQKTSSSSSNNNTEQYVCEPCNKKYKTRNGYQYHSERCKYLRFESTIANTVIQCICEDATLENSTLIECTRCNTWLHSKCVNGSTLDESRFCCPRCLADVAEVDEEDVMEGEHLLQNGTTIKLSELCQAKERGKNLLQSFIDTRQEEEEDPFKAKPIRNEFNFISLFSDDTLTSYSPVLQSSWEQDTLHAGQPQREEEEEDDDDEGEIPSLLFSDNMDDLPSSDLSLPQSDWFHFANFEDDYLAEEQDLLL